MGILLLPVYLILLPMLLGAAVAEEPKQPPLPLGMMLQMALFQLTGLPFVLLGRSMKELTIWVNIIYLSAGLFCFLHILKRGRLRSAGLGPRQRAPLILPLVFFLLLVFQLYQAVTLAPFDGDDAYYIAQSVATAEQGDLYRTIPYTGFATALDARHALAIFPLWIAFLSEMTGIHATILAHTLLPLFLIPLTYIVYGMIGQELLNRAGAADRQENRKASLWGFLILAELLMIFGAPSIYPASIFFLTRTWQGKSVLANLVLPMVCYIMLRIGRRREVLLKTGILLFCTNIAAALCTTMGVFLTALVIAGAGTALAIYHRSLRLLFRLFLCCIPCLLYAGLYVIL